MTRLPIVDDSRIISERSEIILRNCFSPEHWGLIKIPQESDYGLDFRVERRLQGQNTGQDFFVQLKGFAKDTDRKSIGVRIDATTITYWRTKLIPILLVAVDCSKTIVYCDWFNRAITLDSNQQSVTISIPRARFDPESIAHFVDDYYRGFISAIKDNELRRILSKLLLDSLVQASAASEGLFYLMTVPPTMTDPTEKATAIQNFFLSISRVFVGFARNVPNFVKLLDNSGFIENLSNNLTELAQFFQNVFLFTTNEHGEVEPRRPEPGMAELVFCNREKILDSLPYLMCQFNSLNRALAEHLLKAQDYILSTKQESSIT